jgi:hypothetical protein
MNDRQRLAYTLALSAVVAAGAGCGGGSGGPARARLRAEVEFPERVVPVEVGAQVIPQGANVVVVEVRRLNGQLLGRLELWRSQGPPSDTRATNEIVQPAEKVSGTIRDLPVGAAVVLADAYPYLDTGANAQSTPGPPPSLAHAEAIVDIEPGNNFLELTLESLVATVEVMPPSATVNVGETEQFYATARNGDGQILIGATFDWTCSDTGCACVDANGLATGLAAGTVDIHATEGASGVSGQGQLTVESGQVEGDVLILQDEYPWGYNPNPTVASNLGLNPKVITCWEINYEPSLDGYKFIVLASDQTGRAYLDLITWMSMVGDYVSNQGGVFVVHMATGLGLIQDTIGAWGYEYASGRASPEPTSAPRSSRSRSSRARSEVGARQAFIPPCGDGITFVTDLGTNIDVANALSGLITGPGGTITDTNLDGGNLSTHGYALTSTLPAGADVILHDGDPTHAVCSSYPCGAGDVLVTTIPVEWYDAGNHGDQPNIGSIYHPNEFAHACALREGN